MPVEYYTIGRTHGGALKILSASPASLAEQREKLKALPDINDELAQAFIVDNRSPDKNRYFRSAKQIEDSRRDAARAEKIAEKATEKRLSEKKKIEADKAEAKQANNVKLFSEKQKRQAERVKAGLTLPEKAAEPEKIEPKQIEPKS